MKARLSAIVAIPLLFGGMALYALTSPDRVDPTRLPAHQADYRNGERLFWAGGCASCHARPGAKGDEKLILSGGVALETPFGSFRAPNISPDAEVGIGGWTVLDFVNAMSKGVSPAGEHYYPAFPYTSYQYMPIEDLMDLKAFLDRLPSSNNRVDDHDLSFPFNIRRGLGLWKRLYLSGEAFSVEDTRPQSGNRGRYLVEGPGHCGSCHTERNWLGGKRTDRHLAGAVAFEGSTASSRGLHTIPNITSHEDGIGNWSLKDLIFAFESGLKPDFDSFGGSMVSVQENMANLPPEDRLAIAQYLKTIRPLASVQDAQ